MELDLDDVQAALSRVAGCSTRTPDFRLGLSLVRRPDIDGDRPDETLVCRARPRGDVVLDL
ncbi:hypothetical protein [Amycolatopsis sp. lyj-23]|uniref:hypothetical protein n=1 Tax=Amycolatopsis sp. lyj-23 TaxID=2789283 RepID=UPI00397E4EBE